MPERGSHKAPRPITGLLDAPSPAQNSVEPVAGPSNVDMRHRTNSRINVETPITGPLGRSTGVQLGQKRDAKSVEQEKEAKRAAKPMQPMSALLSTRAPARPSVRNTPRTKDALPANERLSRQTGPSQRTKRVLADSDELQEWEKEATRLMQRKQRRSEPEPVDDSQRAEREAVSKGEDRAIVDPPRQEPQKKALQSLSTLGGLNLPPPPKRLKPPHDPPLNNDPPPVKRPHAAVFDLSSLAPVSLPRAKKVPQPLAPKAKPTRHAEPLSRLSALVPPVQVKREDVQTPDRKPAQALTSLKPPPAAEIALDKRANEEVETEEWSPKKRKAGYLASGMAARASSLFAGAKTEQTLWLHDFSRRLASLVPAALPSLKGALEPDVRVVVLEVLSFGSDEVDSFMMPDRRRERRTTLATCRLIQEPRRASAMVGERDDWLAAPTRETQGVVLFSLHDQLGQAGSGSARSVPLPSPTKHARTNSASSSSPEKSRERSLAVPAIPPDLRLIRPGAEVWIWEPFHEVQLVRNDDVVFDLAREPVEAPEPTQEVPSSQDDGPAVVWVPQTPPGGHLPFKEEISEPVARKSLVCSRFAVLV